MVQNLLRTPGQWTWFNGDEKRTIVLRVRSIVFNSYLGENVFTASAHASLGESTP